jgi:hypothetical protein
MPLERTDALKYSDYVRGRLWVDVAEEEEEEGGNERLGILRKS